MIITKHLKTGWGDPEFDEKINKFLVDNPQYHYKDIKVSSKTDDCLLILVYG